MPEFFAKFPIQPYDVNRDGRPTRVALTNILFRLAFIAAVKNNGIAYYPHAIRDHETPEILAEGVYGTPEAHWVVLMVNDMVDPQFDWPLTSEQFGKFIIDKYGSVAIAQTTVHHYQRVVHRRDLSTGTDTYEYVEIDGANPNANVSVSLPDVPYDSFDGLPADEPAGVIFTLPDGHQATEAVYRASVTCWDWEVSENEAKREIRLVNPQYWPQIQEELQILTRDANPELRLGYRTARI